MAYFSPPAYQPPANRPPQQPYFGGNPLLSSYVKQNELAQKEIEQRYLDSLKGRQELRDRSLGQIANWGQSLTGDIAADYADNIRSHDISGKNLLGDLASRGLNGSSMRASVQNSQDRGLANIEQKRAQELTRAKDTIIGRQTATDAALSDPIYAMMERRNDIQPDFSQLQQIFQGLGQGGYGSGYFGQPNPGQPGMAPPTTPGQPVPGWPIVGGGLKRPIIGGWGRPIVGGGNYFIPARPRYTIDV
jgi:hypothetical protein